MNLIIDIGNSSAKVAIVCHNSSIVANYCYPEFNVDVFEGLIAEYPNISGVIISTTRKNDTRTESYVKSKIDQTIILNHQTPTPLKNLYATPETLGMDRLAAAVGAWNIAPNKELLIFDFGTAITIDRVTTAGEFVGGNIAPGMDMRFRALNNYTARLPLLSYESGNHADGELFGCDTNSAIWCGVVRGIEHEIDGYMAQNPDATVFFTGADAKYFGKSTKSAIFADYQLVIKGLDRIIEYNAAKSEF